MEVDPLACPKKSGVSTDDLQLLKIHRAKNLQNSKPRYLSIDIFRGITITAMIFVNYIGNYVTTPTWSLHAHDIGLT